MVQKPGRLRIVILDGGRNGGAILDWIGWELFNVIFFEGDGKGEIRERFFSIS